MDDLRMCKTIQVLQTSGRSLPRNDVQPGRSPLFHRASILTPRLKPLTFLTFAVVVTKKLEAMVADCG